MKKFIKFMAKTKYNMRQVRYKKKTTSGKKLDKIKKLKKRQTPS